MSRRGLIFVFLLACAAQLAAPAWMIGRREWILRHGERFRFKTAPVDPFDAFRGRYVALRLADRSVTAAPGVELEKGRRVWVGLRTDEQGFARFAGAALERPASPCLEARVEYASGNSATIYSPIDRFYMPEDLAPRAEAEYRKFATQATNGASVAVRVWRGQAVVEDLYFGDRSVLDYLKTAK